MVTLIFADCERKYGDHIIIFFETLKNHVEDFGWLAKIDLRGISIKKSEFNDILDICETIMIEKKIVRIINSQRQEKIEQYLGMFLDHNENNNLAMYCAKNGYIDILKYARNQKEHKEKIDLSMGHFLSEIFECMGCFISCGIFSSFCFGDD